MTGAGQEEGLNELKTLRMSRGQMAKVNKNDIKLFKTTWLQVLTTDFMSFIDMY